MLNRLIKKLPKHLLPALLFALVIPLALSGCTKTGKLDEGECKCNVSFTNIPQELTMLEDNLQENFAVNVTLKNRNTNTIYKITLSEDNSFKEQISLKPGEYHVESVETSQAFNTGFTLAAMEESVTLAPDTLCSINIYVEDKGELTEHWMSIQPMPEITLAEKFDGLIQFNRQIIDLRTDSATLLSQLNIAYDGKISPKDKKKVSDDDLGITVVVQNQTDSKTTIENCQIVELYVYKNNVVFPQGVTLGMSPQDICNSETGIYGTPDSFTGSLLYGLDFDSTSAVYKESETGDKLTITLDPNGSAIQGIRYELNSLEE